MHTEELQVLAQMLKPQQQHRLCRTGRRCRAMTPITAQALLQQGQQVPNTRLGTDNMHQKGYTKSHAAGGTHDYEYSWTLIA